MPDLDKLSVRKDYKLKKRIKMKIERLKNKSTFALPILALSIAFSACSEESGVEAPKEIDKGQAVTFKANPLDAETRAIGTKVALNPSTNPNSRQDELAWENGDKISFHFYDKTLNRRFTAPEGFEVTANLDGSADLTGAIPTLPGKYSIYAVSPMNDRYFEYNQLGQPTLTIDQTQTQSSHRNTEHLSKHLYLYSSLEDAIDVVGADEWSGNADMDFQVIPSLLRFDIENNSSQSLKLKAIKISYPEGDGRLYRSVRLDEEDGTFIPSETNAYSEMTLDLQSATLQPESTYTGYLAVFPSEHVGEMKVEILIEEHSIVYDITTPVFEAGTRYYTSLTINDSQLTYLITLGSFEDNGFTYETVAFRPEGHASDITYMITPSRNSAIEHDGQYYVRGLDAHNHCPTDYRLPDPSELTIVRNHLANDSRLRNVFLIGSNDKPSSLIIYNHGLIIPLSPDAFLASAHTPSLDTVVGDRPFYFCSAFDFSVNSISNVNHNMGLNGFSNNVQPGISHSPYFFYYALRCMKN